MHYTNTDFALPGCPTMTPVRGAGCSRFGPQIISKLKKIINEIKVIQAGRVAAFGGGLGDAPTGALPLTRA